MLDPSPSHPSAADAVSPAAASRSEAAALGTGGLPDASSFVTEETAPLSASLPPLFSLGKILATPGALDALREAGVEPNVLLERHERGDWGDLCAEDRAVNRKALLLGDRLLSSYTLPASPAQRGQTIWILTEWDRSLTTLLLPSEY